MTVWQDGGAGVPPAVDLAEVASSDGVVVAVGQNDSSDAVIHRRGTGGDWIQDLVNLPAGAQDSNLVDVAISLSAGWAVGTYTDTMGTHPLTLQIAGGQTALADGTTQATWSPAAETLPGTVDPTAVALVGTDGMIAATDGGAGKVYPFHDGAGSIDDPVTPAAPAAGPINAIAMYAAGKGLTGGELQAGGGTDRIFKIDLTQALPANRMLPVLSAPSDPDLPMAGIGVGDSESEGVAVEANPNPDLNQDPGTWAPSPSLWTRDGASGAFTPDSFPSDLSLKKVTSLEQAVAGTHLGTGAAWRRTGTGAWTRDDPPGSQPLNGIAVVAADDIWTVGDNGTVLRYAERPLTPPVTFIDTGPGNTVDPNPTFTFSSDDPGSTFECRVGTDPFTSCASPETLDPQALGTHTFQVRATSPNGTDTSPDSNDTRSFTVVAPETTLDGPSGTTTDTTPTFLFSSDYAGASYQCSVDGSAFFSCASPLTTSELPEGDHSFQVRAVSSASADPSPATRAFKVDIPDGPCKPVPRPLVRNVTVRKRPGMLLIEFDLAADSRVKAKAFHDEELIGRTKEKVLKLGHHELKLRYGAKKGKPTRLKMLARPAATDACR